jgi:hypothetical protein
MINYWAVLVSAVAAMVIGAIWWGRLFGKMWNKENGFDKLSSAEKEALTKSMNSSYAQQFILSLVQGGVLAYVLKEVGSYGIGSALKYAAIVWLGFIMPIHYGNKLWGNKKLGFIVATLGSSLLTILIAALIIGAW